MGPVAQSSRRPSLASSTIHNHWRVAPSVFVGCLWWRDASCTVFPHTWSSCSCFRHLSQRAIQSARTNSGWLLCCVKFLIRTVCGCHVVPARPRKHVSQTCLSASLPQEAIHHHESRWQHSLAASAHFGAGASLSHTRFVKSDHSHFKQRSCSDCCVARKCHRLQKECQTRRHDRCVF